MQIKSARRSNEERSRTTRDALVAAARRIFVEKGYADTGTPEIVQTAAVTRGALYHHFADKADLFRCVLRQEFERVAAEIQEATSEPMDALTALKRGATAFMKAMTAPGRARLMLLDGPAAFGRAEMDSLDRETSAGTLRQGLDDAMRSGQIATLPAAELTDVISAMFDRAAMEAARGGNSANYLAVMEAIIDGLRKP
jgi:AcrR family transcriptional regulator